jgi:hypothetical protein
MGKAAGLAFQMLAARGAGTVWFGEMMPMEGLGTDESSAGKAAGGQIFVGESGRGQKKIKFLVAKSWRFATFPPL